MRWSRRESAQSYSTVAVLMASLCAGLCGCVMFEVGVTNPVAGLTTVAVAPFFNLSAERAVDGRRFAEAYFTELQKTPGFQVLPVGVVEQAIHDHSLQMNSPDDALRLATILGVDAVVMGAVTDYSPYYPPRIGLQVSWYSPRPWVFVPGVPVDEMAREFAQPSKFSMNSWRGWGFGKKSHTVYGSPVATPAGAPEACPPTAAAMPTTFRGQSPTDGESSWWPRWANPLRRSPEVFPLKELAPDDEVRQVADSEAIGMEPGPLIAVPSPPPAVPVFNPRQPLMAYTRMFDGSDPLLTARLRDYVELSGDLRSGGWQAYLHRSEDFIRFTSHVMIVEMLQLHGGEARRRIVVKHRKYR